MAVVCATCGVKKPPLSPMSDENLQLVDAVVTPFVNMRDFRGYQLLICVNCNLLISGVRSFQVTARSSLRALKSLLNELDRQPATFVEPIVEAKPEPIIIKIEPEDDLPTTNQHSSVLASNDKIPQGKELELTPDLESKSELNYDSESSMGADETPDLMSDLDLDPLMAGSLGSSATTAGQTKKKYTVPIVDSKPCASNLVCRVYTKKPEPKPTQIKKTIIIKNALKPPQAAKIAQAAKDGLNVTSVKTVKPILIDLEQRVTTKWQIAENAAKVAPEVGNLDLLIQETIEASKAPLPEDHKESRKRKKKVNKLEDVSCPHCNKIVKGKFYLREHIERFHVNLKPSPCDTCGKVCRNEKALRAHVKQSHERKVKTIDDLNPELFCVECSAHFPSRAAYKNHQMSRKHMPKEQYTIECETCKKRFPTEKRLKLHNDLVHLNKKPYKCDTCDKTFGRVGELTRHMVVHNKLRDKLAKKTHVCHVCGKSFTNPRSLEEHLLVHQGLRPYECKLCLATFSYKAALFNHNRLKHLKMKLNYKKKTKQDGVEQDDERVEKDGVLKKRKADKVGVDSKVKQAEKGGGIGKDGELKKGTKVEETREDKKAETVEKEADEIEKELGIGGVADSRDIDSYFVNM